MSEPNYSLFENGNRFVSWLGSPSDVVNSYCTPQVISIINLPSGQVYTSDPVTYISEYSVRPYTRTVPPGRYPVLLSLLNFVKDKDSDTSGHPMNAAAMIRISDETPVTWEMALSEGDDVAALLPGRFFGYGVDSGNAGFISLEAGRELLALWSAWKGIGDAPMANHGLEMHEEIILPGHPDLNIISFRAGMGDGSYATYWGLDVSGTATCLITDFGLVSDPNETVE